MSAKQRGSVYKRLETDAEFRERLSSTVYYVPSFGGRELDDFVWYRWKKQRRIIEVEA